jgi:hypothetical protein
MNTLFLRFSPLLREGGSESMIIADTMRREVGDFSLVSLLMAHQSS